MDTKSVKSSNIDLGDADFFDSSPNYKKDFINLDNIKDTGYYFDENGILRYIKDNSPFPFKSFLVPLFKVRYDIFRTLTAKYVREILYDIGVISEIIFTSKVPSGLRILHSKHFLNHTGPLMVIIQAGGVTRAGVWSPRLLMHTSGGINVASQLNQLKKAIENNYAVLVINPNEKIPTKSCSKDVETSPEEIIHSIWRSIIPKCKASQILIWGHMYGGTAFLYPLQPPPDLKILKKSSITSNSNNYFKNSTYSFADTYNQHVSSKYTQTGYSFENTEMVSSSLNCVTMDLTNNKLMSKSESLELDPRLVPFVIKQRDQPVMYPSISSNVNNEFKLPTNYQKSTKYPLSNKQSRTELDFDSELPTISNLQQIIDADDLTSRNNGIDLLFPDSKLLPCSSSSLLNNGKRTTNVSGNSAQYTDSSSRKTSTSLRKRTSVSSNNATDNSSLHSENSFSGFSASSPKQRCFIPLRNEQQKSKMNINSPYENMQKILNEKWTERRNLFWKSIDDRVAGIVFTDSAICLKMQGIMEPHVLSWFKENAVHYVACVEDLGSDLNKASFSINEVITKSAGTAEHDIIPHLVTEEAFIFFQKQLNKVGRKGCEGSEEVMLECVDGV